MADLRDIFKYTVTNNFLLEAAMFNIPGVTVQRQFFDNPNVDTTIRDVWKYGGTQALYDYIPNYTEDPGEDCYIFSNDAGDTQEVEVLFQDELGIEFNARYTLNGITPVKLNDLDNVVSWVSDNQRKTAFKITRIYRIENRGAAGEDFAGTVYATKGNAITGGEPDNSADVQALVVDGDNKTLMCHYTIPADMWGFFFWVDLSVTKKQAVYAETTFHFRRLGSVFRIEDKMGISTTGSSDSARTLAIPAPIPPLDDIVIRASADSPCGISGSYQVLLVKPEFVRRAQEVMAAAAKIY